ncbi:MAG: hypothetical protein HY898_21000 [Deltaproteobacteria bacterium]|nr:hypothetical protein [Deltaproteobacteria bacterium]
MKKPMRLQAIVLGATLSLGCGGRAVTSTQAGTGPDPVCLGDSCHDGICTPVSVAHLPATGDGGSSGSGVIAVDARNIYLTRSQGNNAVEVLRVGKCGGEVKLIQSLTTPYELLVVADDSAVFWFPHGGPKPDDLHGIWVASPDVEAQPFVVPQVRPDILALNSTRLFWIGLEDRPKYLLESMSRAGGEIDSRETATSGWVALAADDEYLYQFHDGIVRTPIAGGDSVKIADGRPCEGSLVATARHVMWAECPDMDPGPAPFLVSIPRTGGERSVLLDPFRAWFVAHNDRVYFDLDDGVYELPEDGGKPRQVLGKAIDRLRFRFAVDDYALYWVEADTVWKVGLAP